jgi:hypothetical protein
VINFVKFAWQKQKRSPWQQRQLLYLRLPFITTQEVIKTLDRCRQRLPKTRQEVLIIESLENLTLDKKGCEVVKGKWHDPYTDKYFTNPNDLDVDHFVPLGEVDRSGGHEWSKDKKKEYANDLDDPEVLIAVDKSANRAKGDKDSSDWLPPNKKFKCDYIKTWQKIKKKWVLEMEKKKRILWIRIIKNAKKHPH